MAGPKVVDFAWGRLQSPDLDIAERFLLDFGFVPVERTATRLYMRGTDPQHHIHVTELGPPKFIGFAYYAANADELRRFAKLPGASGVEHLDEPGGGERVRLTDPHGYQIEIVHGLAPVAPLPIREHVVNRGDDRFHRTGKLMRLRRGPPQVKRIGHGVLMTTQLASALAWYREMLGFVSSDDVYVGEKSNVVASFNRLDRGADYVDHHVFFCMDGPKSGLNHLSFEVQNHDEVFLGHEYLREQGKYEHMWGIGRHILGSQIFDYWCDPWGRVHEHWTDSDMLNRANGSNLIAAEEGFGSQWGERAPEKFVGHATP